MDRTEDEKQLKCQWTMVGMGKYVGERATRIELAYAAWEILINCRCGGHFLNFRHGVRMKKQSPERDLTKKAPRKGGAE